jgi:hypothetical protein
MVTEASSPLPLNRPSGRICQPYFFRTNGFGDRLHLSAQYVG